MKTISKLFLLFAIVILIVNCGQKRNDLSISNQLIRDNYLGDQWVQNVQLDPVNNYVLENGELLLGNEAIPALSYSGYGKETRGKGLPNQDEYCPSVSELKEDMKILAAMGVKLIRTYDTQEYDHAPRL